LMASWKNPANDSSYTQVFAVSNVCNFAPYGLSQGDELYFDLDPNPPGQRCDVCMIFYPTPSVANAVKNVQKIH
ncbi:MAG TPA: hypothetical protein VE035_10590, partial [Puia sp.]|nr:hypothetical protein [Puia sp.]